MIYIIDKVLIPEERKSIVKVLEKRGKFSTLLNAIKIAGLTSNLEFGR